MKTQISNLRSGTKNQITNPLVDYSKLNQATSHVGHGGTNSKELLATYSKVKEENNEYLKILFFGKEYTLKANWSGSGKSVFYSCAILDDDFIKIANNHHKGSTNKLYKVGRGKIGTLIISGDCDIVLSNGKNYYVNICPSLVEII